MQDFIKRNYIYSESAAAASKAAGEEIVAKIVEFSETQEQIIIGLCGGRSPVHLFEALVAGCRGLGREGCRKVNFFQVDERLRSEPNFELQHEVLFSPLLAAEVISSAQVHLFPRQLPPLEAASDYENKLRARGGRFDIGIFGVGPDSHIAGIFPDHSSSASSYDGFITFEESPKPPNGRATATLPLLEKTKFGVFLFFGEEKRGAFEQFIRNKEKLESCPVQVGHHMEDALIVLDLKDAVPE